jgi:hypothetical protein
VCNLVSRFTHLFCVLISFSSFLLFTLTRISTLTLTYPPIFYFTSPSLTPLSTLYVRTRSVPQVNYTGPELSLSATEPLTQVPVELRDGMLVIYFVISFNMLCWYLFLFIIMCVCLCLYFRVTVRMYFFNMTSY